MNNRSNDYLHQLKQRLSSSLDTLEHTECADASVLIAITDEDYPHVLLTRRSSTMKHHAGQVSFAGGHHEPHDSNNTATAIREAFEETNLDPKIVDIIGALKQQQSISGLSVQPIVAIIPPCLTLIAEPREIDRIFWVGLAEFINTPTQDYHFETTVVEKKVTIVTPSWQLNDEIIWGLTGRIIADLLAVVFDQDIAWYYNPIT